MSIAAIAWSWKQDLRPTEKFILVAISDHANDEDYTCWPSLTHLETKTGYNRTTIWRTIDQLVNCGLLSRVGEHKSGATLYKVMVGAQCTYVKPATQVGAQDNMLGAHSNKVGAQDTSNHKNHHESSLTSFVGQGPTRKIEKLNGKTTEAIEVLNFLNHKTGRNYRGLDGNGKPTANLKLVIDRLKSGVSVQDCKTMIARKHMDWAKDDKMWPYLRPSTLFRASNFEQYLGECTTEEKRK